MVCLLRKLRIISRHTLDRDGSTCLLVHYFRGFLPRETMIFWVRDERFLLTNTRAGFCIREVLECFWTRCRERTRNISRACYLPNVRVNSSGDRPDNGSRLLPYTRCECDFEANGNSIPTIPFYTKTKTRPISMKHGHCSVGHYVVVCVPPSGVPNFGAIDP